MLPSQRRTAALAACCHADRLTKRNNVFERKNALKRNVATRPPARFVGKLLTLITFAKPLETKGRSESQQQKALSDFTTYYER